MIEKIKRVLKLQEELKESYSIDRVDHLTGVWVYDVNKFMNMSGDSPILGEKMKQEDLYKYSFEQDGIKFIYIDEGGFIDSTTITGGTKQ